MLQSHRGETAAHKNRVNTAPSSAPFVILLVVALGGMAYGFWHGHWLIVVLDAVTVAIAIWGLHPPRRRVANSDRSPAAGRVAELSPEVHQEPSLQSTSSRAQSFPHDEATHITTTEGGERFPVVASFAITGRIRRTATGAAGQLTVVLPAATEVVADPVVDALLTAGHHVLGQHRLTGRRLPEVDVAAVDRSGKLPTTAPATGFVVHVTNDLTTCHSDITVEADQLLGTGDGALLIAATLLAGAEHLLDHRDRPLHHCARAEGRPAKEDARTPPAPR